jgi:hypothetical protein
MTVTTVPPRAPSTSTKTTTAPPATPTRAASPIDPAFDLKTAKFQGQLINAAQESQRLAKGYFASFMCVGVANHQAAPIFYGYGTHKAMTMGIHKRLPDDRLDLGVYLNVSGHDLKQLPNNKQARQERANDNRYVIQITRPDGTVQRMTGIEARGALSTAQAISLRDMKPGLTVVEAWPEHSAGVGGYLEGRRLEIKYDPPKAAAPTTDSFGR